MATHSPNTANPVIRHDPIGDKYFRPLHKAEGISSWLFYIGVCLSFAPVAIDKASHPAIYWIITLFFCIVTLGIFVLGLAIKLYFLPRAEDERRKEFLSNAFEINLTHERTAGYYNNSETNPYKRIGASTLENLFFSKNMLARMLPPRRIMVGLYLIAWLTIMISNSVNIDWVVAASQALFSEEILAKLLRLEWTSYRAHRLYGAVYQLFQTRPAANLFAAYATNAFADYEAGKAYGGIVFSEKLFHKLNPSLTNEWDNIKLGLDGIK